MPGKTRTHTVNITKHRLFSFHVDLVNRAEVSLYMSLIESIWGILFQPSYAKEFLFYAKNCLQNAVLKA